VATEPRIVEGWREVPEALRSRQEGMYNTSQDLRYSHASLTNQLKHQRVRNLEYGSSKFPGVTRR